MSSRPALLSPLFSPLSSLPSVGAQRALMLEKLCGGGRVFDLLSHVPRSMRTRLCLPSLSALPTLREGETPPHIAILLSIVRHSPPQNARLPYRILCQDANDERVDLLWFRAKAKGAYLRKHYPQGRTLAVCGTITAYQGVAQIAHPECALPEGAFSQLSEREPIWRLTAGITRIALRALLERTLQLVPALPEWIEESFMRAHQWPPWRESLRALHFSGQADRERERLAYDELLAHILALALVKRHWGRGAKQPRRQLANAALLEQFHQRLAFTPTADQQRAVAEIRHDITSDRRMLRLLQGDVGSGKTYVAAAVMLTLLEAGEQTALMAPTELLARQHFALFEEWFSPLGIECAFLSGMLEAKERTRAKQRIESGSAQVIVGTHALFQEHLHYPRLRLAVVDEQHRFGVYQRFALATKARDIDMLVMSATPIPRTLMLAVWGGLECSRLQQKPPGRQAIETRTISLRRLTEVFDALGRLLGQGEKVYWVCPTILEGEEEQAPVSVEERAEGLQKRFAKPSDKSSDRPSDSSPCIERLHARMTSRARQLALERFKRSKAGVLVATSMIEVGIDIPEVNVIVIENAERFGLAQLHQLRGRVGRSVAQGRCLLLYDSTASTHARARLSVLRASQDGFAIAEEDLKLRGHGDPLGVRQSGLPAFRFADLALHHDLAAAAAKQAERVLEQDPWLRRAHSQPLRLLLSLFEKDDSLQMLEAG